MASGKLGIASLAAATWTNIATATAGRVTTANIRIVNRDLINTVQVRLAISAAAGAATDSEHIIPPDFVLEAGGIMEELGVVMSAGEIINAYASAATVTVRAFGFEAIP